MRFFEGRCKKSGGRLDCGLKDVHFRTGAPISRNRLALGRRLAGGTIAFLGIAGWAGVPGLDHATAAAAADIPKLLMHLVPAAGRPRCLGTSELPTCVQMVVEGELAIEYDLYILAAAIEATTGGALSRSVAIPASRPPTPAARRPSRTAGSRDRTSALRASG